MNAKKMFLALVLIATFAVIPSFAIFEKDYISPKTVEAILEKTDPLLKEDAMNALIKTKTIISNPIIEEALLKNSIGPNRDLCFETCIYFGCISASFGCYCYNLICAKD